MYSAWNASCNYSGNFGYCYLFLFLTWNKCKMPNKFKINLMYSIHSNSPEYYPLHLWGVYLKFDCLILSELTEMI